MWLSFKMAKEIWRHIKQSISYVISLAVSRKVTGHYWHLHESAPRLKDQVCVFWTQKTTMQTISNDMFRQSQDQTPLGVTYVSSQNDWLCIT